RELERLQRYPSVAALAFVDIDEFKEVNDVHGHAAGDRALISLAEVFKENIRSVDIVVRYGGEEFVLFFPETGEEAAVQIIERMQRHFQSVSAKKNHVLISFSAGVVEAPRDGDRFEVLCQRADQAMYAAKQSGKACVLPWRAHMKTASRRVRTP
ncbi:MAG: GGDEF domain-containing protein, partial [Candidatus Hydrogenedentota bacterium]